MRLTKGIENLGLPDYIKFGLELEVENVKKSEMDKFVAKFGNYPKNKGWHTIIDASLTDGGVETISPPLKEKEESSIWQEISDVCEKISKSPNDERRESYTDHTCGGHIHFDATEFQKNPKMMENFLRLWAESEELVYKMCNDVNDPIRKSAIDNSHIRIIDCVKALFKNPVPEGVKNHSLREVLRFVREFKRNLSSNFVNSYNILNIKLNDLIFTKNGMASPIGEKIMKQIENGNLKIGKPKSRIYRDTIVKAKVTPERYQGLNLTNIGRKNQNTIEFRMSNGTIDPRVIKENVFLYASIISTAYKMTKMPENLGDRLSRFYNSNVTEMEKAESFLELIMDNPEDRQVYMERWESVKDAEVFTLEGSKNFSKDAFRKDQLKSIAENVKGSKVKECFRKIEGQMNLRREEQAFGRS